MTNGSIYRSSLGISLPGTVWNKRTKSFPLKLWKLSFVIFSSDSAAPSAAKSSQACTTIFLFQPGLLFRKDTECQGFRKLTLTITRSTRRIMAPTNSGWQCKKSQHTIAAGLMIMRRYIQLTHICRVDLSILSFCLYVLTSVGDIRRVFTAYQSSCGCAVWWP